MNRSDHREAIFRDDLDRQRFLATLAEACGKTGWQGHAYCLMPNHFHLVVEISRGQFSLRYTPQCLRQARERKKYTLLRD
jgi:REP element-mobilizing transposase RayT